MSMIDELVKALGQGEAITCTVRRTGPERVQLVVQPALDGGDEDGPGGRDETERQLRQALSRPVKIGLDPAQSLDAQIDQALGGVAESRAPVVAALADYADQLGEAKKAAQSASDTSTAKKGQSGKSGADQASAQSASAATTTTEGGGTSRESNENTNPASLI